MLTNRGQTKLLTELQSLVTILENPNLEVREMVDVTENMMLTTYYHREEIAPIQGNLSLIIAAFTTSYARLKLYNDALCKIPPEQLLYFDTDSVVFVQKKYETPLLEEGEFVGQFKNEIISTYGPGSRVTKFFAAGPKSYGYEVVKSNGTMEKVFKNKGIKLTSRSLAQFSPDDMMQAVMTLNREAYQIKDPQKICRDKRKGTLYNREEIKRWRMVYTKRVLLENSTAEDNYKTLPFGYYIGSLRWSESSSSSYRSVIGQFLP